MREIYIDEDDTLKNIYLIDNNKITEKHVENKKNPMLEGNIYAGKIQNVLPGMKAAFVRIGGSKNAFIRLKDILPKEDLTKKNNSDDEIDIRDVIKPGDSILVQVVRDKNYRKGAKVTSHISFSGRFFVYMPNVPFITVSQKIEDEKVRENLKKIVKEHLLDNVGGVIRTSAAFVKEDEVLEELELLNKRWKDIQEVKIDKLPQKIYDAGGIVRKYIIDNYDIDRILVKNEEIQKEIEKIINEENLKKEVLVQNDYLEKYDFGKQISRMENRKVWLKCGGFITIDKTEAVVAIDVNSGKFIGDDDFEETVFEVNKEATIEIVKQLKLRDLGGIIIIDYIDMHVNENKEKILNLMKEEAKKDGLKIQIAGFTNLNLFELTRQHIYNV